MAAQATDRAIEQLVRDQYGAFSHAQAIERGATERIIHGRLVTGRWILRAPAVYALPSHSATWHQTLMASVLGEPRAAVGGAAAAALHQLAGFPPGPVEIVVPRGSNHRSALATVRERSNWRAEAVVGIPCLTVSDSLFAVAGTAHASRVALALDDALGAGSVTIEELQLRYQELSGGRRRGMGVMRRLIAIRSATHRVPPASRLERLLYRVLDRPGMPAYRRQARVPWSPDQRVDALLVDAPVVIEGDGRRWHTRVADFDRDRRRDTTAAAHGYVTMRFTYDDLRSSPDRVEAEIRAAARATT